jgi:hypothetical protein
MCCLTLTIVILIFVLYIFPFNWNFKGYFHGYINQPENKTTLIMYYCLYNYIYGDTVLIRTFSLRVNNHCTKKYWHKGLLKSKFTLEQAMKAVELQLYSFFNLCSSTNGCSADLHI